MPHPDLKDGDKKKKTDPKIKLRNSNNILKMRTTPKMP